MLFPALLTTLSGAVELKRIPVAEEEATTEPPSPGLYAFGYAAGRFPGNIDRTHSEVSDGSGVIRGNHSLSLQQTAKLTNPPPPPGSYSYIDPRYQIRTVEYTADKTGFHPVLNRQPAPLPRDSPAVAEAKRKHLEQFAAIAEANAVLPGHVVVPQDTAAVQRARNRHFSLFERIAQEHARIAAQREKEQREKGIANELEDEEN